MNMGILIATPYLRPIFASMFESVLHTENPTKFMDWKPVWGLPVDEAREYFAKYIDGTPEFSHTLFADSDCTWHPVALGRLYERDLPIVCGTMYTKEIPPLPTIGDYVRTTSGGKMIYSAAKTCRQISEFIKFHNIKEPPGNALVYPKRPDDIFVKGGFGMHFTLINNEVIRKMEPPRFLMGGETGAGEDFYFCQKAQEMGYETYWDRSVHTGHLQGEQHDVGLKEFAFFDKYGIDYEVVDWIVEEPDPKESE